MNFYYLFVDIRIAHAVSYGVKNPFDSYELIYLNFELCSGKNCCIFIFSCLTKPTNSLSAG